MRQLAAPLCCFVVSVPCFAQPRVLYQNTTSAASPRFYNPGVWTGDPDLELGPSTNRSIIFDDVQIDESVLQGQSHIALTRITVMIARLATMPAANVNFYAAGWNPNATNINSVWDVAPPPNAPAPIATLTMPAVTAPAGSPPSLLRWDTFSVGDGVNPIAVIPAVVPFGASSYMTIGLQVEGQAAWARVTQDATQFGTVTPEIWIYDPDQAGFVGRNLGVRQLGDAPSTRGSQHMIVEGYVVPSPAALPLIATAGLFATRRRRSSLG